MENFIVFSCDVDIDSDYINLISINPYKSEIRTASQKRVESFNSNDFDAIIQIKTL